MKDDRTFIPPHGEYRTLLSYQKATIVYDVTSRFCQRFLQKGDRTIDQMIQAARSGKQNTVEGSKASGTSKETELKLSNVARASLIHQTNYLLDRQIARLEQDFAETGGLRERMTRARLQARKQQWEGQG